MKDRHLPVTVRAASENEHPVLVEIMNRARAAAGCFPDKKLDAAAFRAVIEGEEVFVATMDQYSVGFVAVWRPERFIHHLYVSPEHQNQGVGQALLASCEQAYGLPLSLKCDVGNSQARRFYESLGWIAMERGEGENGLWVRYWLNDRWRERG